MADITMRLDDTLELDTIIKEDSSAVNPIGTVTKISDNSTYNNVFDGFQTKTAVFNPPESGEFKIPVNGQELIVKVRDPAPPNRGVSYYEFEQDLTDSWSNLNGTINNNINYSQTSKYGNYSIESQGNYSNPSKATLGDFLNGDEFTISFWTYCNVPKAIKPPIVSDEKFRFNISGTFDGHNISFIVNGSNSGHRQTAFTLNSNEWYHLVGMYDGSTQYFYVNNTRYGSRTKDYTFTHSESPIELFGQNDVGKKYVYDGLIDNLKFYNKKLTTNELDNLYNNGSISS